MQKQILSVGFFLLSLVLPLKVSAQNYDEIYVFGDSFSDTGNVFHFTSGAIPPKPYFNGRFSNGPVWVEYLASELNLTFNPNTNFAFGGTTTGVDNIGLSILPGLQQQISSFTTANNSANPNALYVVWAGTNDYLDYFLGNIPNPTNSVANLSAAITSLTAIGAEDIMVVNLPDLGKFPVTGGDTPSSNEFSTLTSAHNSSLAASLNSLSQQLSPDINIIPVDVNYLFNQAIANPKKFGFTNVTDSCIGDSPIVPIDISPQPVVCIPDEFLFWDEIHPTTTTHQLIGELAFAALLRASVPEPSVVLGVLTFALSAISLRKRFRFPSR
ncbi:SGNH/GDSL hydrolase family protein [Nostocaceae cyanobacterium CENA357]|uniref:SGNH/GDSL hydrolase family protein n=1 Tax=Atlanticothrix silvestris CENA357 TaxID=1725252 RepID=A0A8J7HBK7_9CYAN|nr:SGNH/GDSL hydrolase family protein [Atlanticothrix silvestris]MBH8552313.1 SGNH/GDSL hydrolase family protein [Atlanticothrix silvestris CENA357]